MKKLRITQINVIKDNTRANLKADVIVTDLEKFRSEMKEKHHAETILFCMEEIEESGCSEIPDSH